MLRSKADGLSYVGTVEATEKSMVYKKLNILGLSYSQTQSGAYALVLEEEEGNRRIPIIIGSFEAQSIAIQLESLTPPRPLTHDLFLSLSSSFDIFLEKVNIYKLEEGIFYSEMLFNNGKEKIKIDARTSDAVALALRYDCSIFTTEDILDKAGISVEESEKVEQEVSLEEEGEFDKTNVEELEKLLGEAIEKEEYEKAAKISSELKKRKTE